MADFNWAGLSGTYNYWWLNNLTPSAIQAKPGNYGFLLSVGDNRWLPVYWGQTNDLRHRLPTHERWAEAQRLGLVRCIAHINTNETSRLFEEADLIKRWNPRLNDVQPIQPLVRR